MKIEYNVLWLDDQIDTFIEDEYVDKIKTHLEEEGFDANVIPVSKPEDFFSHLNDSVDLILTDYNMAEKNGAQIVEEVRSKSIFTEILFYTAKADLQNLDKIDRITFLQTDKISGSTHHEKVVEKAISLIDLTIKKFQHIVAMRGMIMNETSSLDAQSMEILKSYLNCKKKGCGECIDKERCKPIADSIFGKLEQQLKDKQCDVVKLKSNSNLRQLIKDNFLFSADYKIDALSKILESLNIADFSADYKTEIITIRNKFAHAVLEKDEETGREYFKHGEDGITFDENYCKTIRKNINKHKHNLDDLQSKLKS
jgi:CheY-like chemotaxis protein